VLDLSLAADVPADTLVRRVRTWEPRYAVKALVSAGEDPARTGPGFLGQVARRLVRGVTSLLLQPDPQILWVPEAIREGERLLREVPHAAIVVTAPPFSAFLVGEVLSQWTGLPLLLDFRDEWTLSAAYSENRAFDPLSRGLQGYLQHRVVRSADCLLATTRSSARALEALRDEAGSTAQVAWISNGFDADDFPPRPPARGGPPGPFRLAYVGTLWRLTSAAPLVSAVRLFAQRWPGLAGRLELVFAGRRTGEQQRLLDALHGLPCRVVEHAYLDHRVAIELVRSASAVCVLLADLPGAERVMPAKTFEYVAARRTILAIAPPGELAELLRDYPGARLFGPEDVEGVAHCLAEEIKCHRQGRDVDTTRWDPARYDRRLQAGELAQFLNALIRRPHGSKRPGLPGDSQQVFPAPQARDEALV
jgi:hypothetical protein